MADPTGDIDGDLSAGGENAFVRNEEELRVIRELEYPPVLLGSMVLASRL